MIRYTRLAAAPLLAAPLLFAAPAIAQVNPTAQATNQPVNRIVVFGDSLADGGFFLTLDPRIPRDAGSFTTNPDPVAPEVLAALLGLPLDARLRPGRHQLCGRRRAGDRGERLVDPDHDADHQLHRRGRHVRRARPRLHPGRRQRLTSRSRRAAAPTTRS